MSSYAKEQAEVFVRFRGWPFFHSLPSLPSGYLSLSFGFPSCVLEAKAPCVFQSHPPSMRATRVLQQAVSALRVKLYSVRTFLCEIQTLFMKGWFSVCGSITSGKLCSSDGKKTVNSMRKQIVTTKHRSVVRKFEWQSFLLKKKRDAK